MFLWNNRVSLYRTHLSSSLLITYWVSTNVWLWLSVILFYWQIHRSARRISTPHQSLEAGGSEFSHDGKNYEFTKTQIRNWAITANPLTKHLTLISSKCYFWEHARKIKHWGSPLGQKTWADTFCCWANVLPLVTLQLQKWKTPLMGWRQFMSAFCSRAETWLCSMVHAVHFLENQKIHFVQRMTFLPNKCLAKLYEVPAYWNCFMFPSNCY